MLAAQKAAQSSQPKLKHLAVLVLPNSARIKSSSDYARAVKSGRRATSGSLIGYLYSSNNTHTAKLGLIVNKSVGNSVERHRIARQIRHAVKQKLHLFPKGTLFVVRALKKPENAFYESRKLIETIKSIESLEKVTK